MWQRSPPLCDHSCKRARTFNVCSMSDRAMKGDINLSPTCCSRIFPLLLNVNPSTFLFPFSKLAVVCIFCIVSPCILGSQFWKRPCQLGGLQNVGGNINHIDGMCLELIEDLEPAQVEQWYPIIDHLKGSAKSLSQQSPSGFCAVGRVMKWHKEWPQDKCPLCLTPDGLVCGKFKVFIDNS